MQQQDENHTIPSFHPAVALTGRLRCVMPWLLKHHRWLPFSKMETTNPVCHTGATHPMPTPSPLSTTREPLNCLTDFCYRDWILAPGGPHRSGSARGQILRGLKRYATDPGWKHTTKRNKKTQNKTKVKSNFDWVIIEQYLKIKSISLSL